MRRVVVTGLGIVAPTGCDVSTAWEAAVSGRSAIRKITRFETDDLPVRIAGEITDFDASDLLGAKTARQSSRFIQFVSLAADQALKDSNFE